jgi:PAS domain S-box-containing protein
MEDVRRAPSVRGTRRTIGVLAPLIGGAYFGGIVAGVTRGAGNAGHRVIAVQTPASRLEREWRPGEGPSGVPYGLDMVDGIVIVTDAVLSQPLVRIEELRRPVVLVSASDVAPQAPVILPDNAGGAGAAVEHLLEHGHTQIGFVGNLARREIRERFGGYQDALAEHGIQVKPEWLYEAGEGPEAGGAQAAERFFAAGARTTAVVAGTDLNAIGFMKALRSRGLVIPRDQAVISFDHTERGARQVPRLSTVNLHHSRVGELAVRQLLALIAGEEATRRVRRVPATLLTRESCGCSGASTRGETRRGRTASSATAMAPGRTRLHRLVETAFAGPVGSLSSRYADEVARAGWVRAVLEPLDVAAERGGTPSTTTLERLNDLTGALQPHPEALEQCIAALREIEAELGAGIAVGSKRHVALRKTTTDVLLAVVRGCTRPALVRGGYLERVVADQCEVDMELFSAGGESPRKLAWLPPSLRGSACLGLWVEDEASPDGREIEIVGVFGKGRSLGQIVGHRMSASQFPPTTLTRSEKLDNASLTFVLPVVSPENDWGILAINGRVDPQAAYPRDRFQHWASLLATALDHEARIEQLETHARTLRETASWEHSVADEARARDQRQRLWLGAIDHGTWDWDVLAGTVHYSAQWKRAMGYYDDEIGTSPNEWLDRVHPDDRGGLSALIAASLGGARSPLHYEHRVCVSSGEYRWMTVRAVPVLDDAGCPSRLVGALVDVTERKERELALASGILRDRETGLANRPLFADRLQRSIDRAHRSKTFDCALILLRVVTAEPGVRDADAEPRVEITELVRSALREGEGARLGADEFAILLEDVGPGGDPERTAELLAPVRRGVIGSVASAVLESVRSFRDADEALRTAGIALLRDRALLESAMTPARTTSEVRVAPSPVTPEGSVDVA